MPLSNLSVNDRNTDIPFFPSITYNLLNADFGVLVPTFSWIQAFFSPDLTVAPTLCVYGGWNHADGTPILSEIQFAFSGERINIKGCAIYASGTNIRDQAVTSTPIGSSVTTQITNVIAYGGMN